MAIQWYYGNQVGGTYYARLEVAISDIGDGKIKTDVYMRLNYRRIESTARPYKVTVDNVQHANYNRYMAIGTTSANTRVHLGQYIQTPGYSKYFTFEVLSYNTNYPGNMSVSGSFTTESAPPPPTTICGLPQSVSINPSGIIAPGDTVTVSWSGATNGTGNTITGYDIDYATSSDGSSWSSWTYRKTVNTTSGSGSWDDVPGISRGQYQKYRVRTRGTAGSNWYSGYKESSNTIQMNRLPVMSSLTRNKTVIPEQESSTITYSGSADSGDSGQSITKFEKRFYRSDGSVPNWSDVTSSNGTFSFSETVSSGDAEAGKRFECQVRAYDGKEYSSVSTVSTTVNTKPVINSITTTPDGDTVAISTFVQWSASDADSGQTLKYDLVRVSASDSGMSSNVTEKTVASQISANSYTDDYLGDSSTPEGYYVAYKVRATDTYNWSNWSSTVKGGRKNQKPNAPTFGF